MSNKIILISPLSMGEFYYCDGVKVDATGDFVGENEEFVSISLDKIPETEEENIKAIKAYCFENQINPSVIILSQGCSIYFFT